MSSVAQKLCEGIQTSVQHSLEDVCKATKRARSQDRIQKASKSDVGARNRKSIIIERQKTINNIPKDSAIEKQFRSKEIFTKKYKSLKNIAVNTAKSGTLKCDTNCVTIVRAREKDHKHCMCKSPKQRNITDEVKVTQTDIPQYANKASCGCIEMITCGTQFVDTSSHKMLINPLLRELKMGSQRTNSYDGKVMVNRNDLKHIFNSDLNQHGEYDYGKRIPEYYHEMENVVLSNSNKPCKSSDKSGHRWESPEFNRYNQKNYFDRSKEISKSQNFMGARSWALSKYITRGPDF